MSNPFTNHTLVGPDGRPVGVFVPTEELDRLLAENAKLKAEAADDRREREQRLDALEQFFLTWEPKLATAEEWEESARAGDNSHVIDAIVARLTAAGGGDGNR